MSYITTFTGKHFAPIHPVPKKDVTPPIKARLTECLKFEDHLQNNPCNR